MVDRHTNTHMETKLKYFDGHSRPSQSEENECMLAYDKDGIILVMCSHTFHPCCVFTYICSKYFDFVSMCVFVCLSTVNSSIFGQSSHFAFPYFVLFILWYFPFHVVYLGSSLTVVFFMSSCQLSVTCCRQYFTLVSVITWNS